MASDILRTAHSPLPWSVEVADRAKPRVMASDPEDENWPWLVAQCEVGTLNDKTGKNNAAFIVRACNAHYQMLEALKVAQASLAMLTEPAHVRTSTVHQAWGQAVEAELKVRLAIAAAEAEAGR